ncbi:MAG TPA: hypothetical protein DIV54_05225 [Verrucomicrobiales bacterium]|nr:hypothetical protein [Verrucomicrobiales bacterium]
MALGRTQEAPGKSLIASGLPVAHRGIPGALALRFRILISCLASPTSNAVTLIASLPILQS